MFPQVRPTIAGWLGFLGHRLFKLKFEKKLRMFFSRVFAKVWGPGLNVLFPTRMVDSYGRVNVGLYIYVYIYIHYL